MHEAKLETEDGHHVVTAMVPPFLTWPKILIWGERFFSLFKVVDETKAVYREAFTVAVVVTKEGI